MSAQLRWSGAAVVLLFVFFVGLGEAVAQDDGDIPDIYTPGGSGSSGGGSSNTSGGGGGFTVCVDPGFVEAGLTSGFEISSPEGTAVYENKETGIQVYGCDDPLTAMIDSLYFGSTTLGVTWNDVLVQGNFTARMSLAAFRNGKANLTLRKEMSTKIAVIYIWTEGLAGLTGEDLEEWAAKGACHAVPIRLIHNCNLDLSRLIVKAFGNGSALSELGLLQVEFDEHGNVTTKTSMVIKHQTHGQSHQQGGGGSSSCEEIEISTLVIDEVPFVKNGADGEL